MSPSRNIHVYVPVVWHTQVKLLMKMPIIRNRV